MAHRSQPEPPRYLLDRSLGSKIVPTLLREAGFELVTLADVYGEKGAQLAADTEWLRYAGDHDLVVLGADDRIRYRAQERNQLAGGRLRSFTITNAHLRGEEAAQWILTNRHRIEQRCRKTGPYVYGIYHDRLDKLWPK